MPEKETQVKYACKGPKVKGGGNVGCGAELTELVLNVPADGEQHLIACPACSTEAAVSKGKPAG